MPSPPTLHATGSVETPTLDLTYGVLLPNLGVAAVSSPGIGPGAVPVTATAAIPTVHPSTASSDANVIIGDVLIDELKDTLTTTPTFPVAFPTPEVTTGVGVPSVAAVTQFGTVTTNVSSEPTTIGPLTAVAGVAAIPSPAVAGHYTLDTTFVWNTKRPYATIPLPTVSVPVDAPITATTINARGKVSAGAQGLVISSTNNTTLVPAVTVHAVIAVPLPSITEGQGVAPSVSPVAAMTAIPPVAPSTESTVTKMATTVAASAAFPIAQPETGGDANKLASPITRHAAVPQVSIASPVGVSTVSRAASVPRPKVGVRFTAINDINVLTTIPTPAINNARTVDATSVDVVAAFGSHHLAGILPTWTHFDVTIVRHVGLEDDRAGVPA